LTEEEVSEEDRQGAIRLIIDRLNFGQRDLIKAFQWSRGDCLAANITDLPQSLLFILHAYVEIYGTTDGGKSNLADEDLFKKAKELIQDLSSFLKVSEKLDKRPHAWEIRYKIIPTLQHLDEKYSKLTGTEIEENLGLLETLICNEIMKIEPRLIAHITTVMAMNTGGGYVQPFNPAYTPRFRRPDIDGTQRER
jgi:hypothetical protein